MTEKLLEVMARAACEHVEQKSGMRLLWPQYVPQVQAALEAAMGQGLILLRDPYTGANLVGADVRSDKKSGLEDDPTYREPCFHPEHNPPSNVYIPPGKRYRHICQVCRLEIVLRGARPLLP